jgi:hypothetical protein
MPSIMGYAFPKIALADARAFFPISNTGFSPKRSFGLHQTPNKTDSESERTPSQTEATTKDTEEDRNLGATRCLAIRGVSEKKSFIKKVGVVLDLAHYIKYYLT